MANDLFGGLGGLMKGFSSFMPKDDPNVQLLNAQTEVSDLEQQETALYAEIGRQAANLHGLERFGDAGERLRLVQSNLDLAKGNLKTLQDEKEAQEREERAEAAKTACPGCGAQNPEGMKFCSECGAKLGALACASCGAALPPGTRFCGECGARQE